MAAKISWKQGRNTTTDGRFFLTKPPRFDRWVLHDKTDDSRRQFRTRKEAEEAIIQLYAIEG